MLRTIIPIAALAMLAGCGASQPYEMSERNAAQLKEALAGKVAGEPQDCLPMRRHLGSHAIDSKHILFKQGTTTWLNQPEFRCPLLGGAGYAIVVEPFAGGRLCKGDLARVIDTGTGQMLSSCQLGQFVPYREASAE